MSLFKKVLRASASLLVAGSMLAGVTLPGHAFSDTDGKPDLYEINDGNSSIFIFGTVHFLPPKLDWRKEIVAEKIKSADTVFFELDIDDPTFPQQAAAAMQKYQFGPAGSSLKADLGDAYFDKLAVKLGAVGIPAAVIDRLNPGMVVLTIAQVSAAEQGWDPSSGVEQQLLVDIQAAGHDINGIETIEGQLEALQLGGRDEQIALLKSTIDSDAEAAAASEKMLQAWLNDDKSSLLELLEATDEGGAFEKNLIVERNNSWMPVLEAQLAADKAAFIAVGALHLWGESGIITQLQNKGFTVTRH